MKMVQYRTCRFNSLDANLIFLLIICTANVLCNSVAEMSQTNDVDWLRMRLLQTLAQQPPPDSLLATTNVSESEAPNHSDTDEAVPNATINADENNLATTNSSRGARKIGNIDTDMLARLVGSIVKKVRRAQTHPVSDSADNSEGSFMTPQQTSTTIQPQEQQMQSPPPAMSAAYIEQIVERVLRRHKASSDEEEEQQQESRAHRSGTKFRSRMYDRDASSNGGEEYDDSGNSIDYDNSYRSTRRPDYNPYARTQQTGASYYNPYATAYNQQPTYNQQNNPYASNTLWNPQQQPYMVPIGTQVLAAIPTAAPTKSSTDDDDDAEDNKRSRKRNKNAGNGLMARIGRMGMTLPMLLPLLSTGMSALSGHYGAGAAAANNGGGGLGALAPLLLMRGGMGGGRGGGGGKSSLGMLAALSGAGGGGGAGGGLGLASLLGKKR